MLGTEPELYVKTLGRMVKITKIVHSAGEANEWCVAHPYEAVIAEDQQGHIFLAKTDDLRVVPESDFLRPVART